MLLAALLAPSIGILIIPNIIYRQLKQFFLGESSSGQPGSAAAGQSTDPCGGMSLKISTSVEPLGRIEGASRESLCVFGSSSPPFNVAKPALDGPRA